MIAWVVIVAAFTANVALLVAVAYYLPPRGRGKRRRRPGARRRAPRARVPKWWGRPLVSSRAQRHQLAAMLTEQWRYPEER